MIIKLSSLRVGVGDLVQAEFVSDDSEKLIRADFSVDWISGVATASPSPDVFQELSVPLGCVRAVVAAVLAFAEASGMRDLQP